MWRIAQQFAKKKQGKKPRVRVKPLDAPQLWVPFKNECLLVEKKPLAFK